MIRLDSHLPPMDIGDMACSREYLYPDGLTELNVMHPEELK